MLLTQRLAQRDHGTLPSAHARTIRMQTLLDALLTDMELREVASLPQIRAHMTHVTQAFGTLRAQEVTEALVDRFMQAQRTAGAAPASVNRRVQLLQQALALGYRRQQVTRLPTFRKLPVQNAREGFFEDRELAALLPHLPLYLRDVTLFGYYTGWRLGEILSLEWRDVDLPAQTIRLRSAQSKNRRGRHLSLHVPLRALLAERLAARTAGDRIVPYVFHRNGRKIGRIASPWKAATRKAGIPHRLFHDLRRTAVRNMIRAGIPERVAMEMSGHRTRSMFDRYHIVSDTDLRDAMQKLEDVHHAPLALLRRAPAQ